MSRRRNDIQLPISRVKTIMKSSPDVEAVGPEPLLLVTKVTELFIADLAKRAFDNSKDPYLDYRHLANLVQRDDTLDFLREIMPCKITVRQFKELMAKKANKKGDEDSSESGSDEEDEEEAEEEESEGESNPTEA